MKISFRGFAAAATLALAGGMAQAEPLEYWLESVVWSSPFAGAGVIGIDFDGVCPSCSFEDGSRAVVDGSNVSLSDVSFGLTGGASNFLLTVESAQTIVGMGVALIKSGVTCDALVGSACLETSTRSALGFPVDFTGQAADGTLCEACEVNVILSNDLQNLTVEIRKQLTQGFAGQQFYALNYTLVPVPAAVWLFASALGLVGWMGRRRARAA